MTKTMRTLLILNSFWMVLCAAFIILTAWAFWFDFRMSSSFPYHMLMWTSLALGFCLTSFSTFQFEKPRPWIVFILCILYIAVLFSWFCIDVSDAYYELWNEAFTEQNTNKKPHILREIFPGMINQSVFYAILLLPPVYVNILHPIVQSKFKKSIHPPLPKTT